MNLADIRILYLREMRSAFRERSIVLNGILIPILLYPLLIWLVYTGFTFVSGQSDDLQSRVMLKDLPSAHKALATQLTDDETVELKNSANPIDEIRDGSLDVLIEFYSAEVTGSLLRENFRSRITYDESRDRSVRANERIRDKLSAYREQFIKQEALKAGIDPATFQRYEIEEDNVSTDRQMGQFVMGLMLPMMLIVMLAVGCFYPAIDSTAGERENSTWETIMTAATSRTNIVVAKYLYVASMAFIAALLNLVAMLFSMRGIIASLMPNQETMSFMIPLRAIPLILAGAVLLALFIAAAMMIPAAFARTFKEGQSMVSPLYIALILPINFLQNPGQELTPGLALVPLVNVVLMFREAIIGTYQWPLIGITMVVEVFCVFVAISLAIALLRYEDVVVGSYGGSFGQFFKQRILKREL